MQEIKVEMQSSRNVETQKYRKVQRRIGMQESINVGKYK